MSLFMKSDIEVVHLAEYCLVWLASALHDFRQNSSPALVAWESFYLDISRIDSRPFCMQNLCSAIELENGTVQFLQKVNKLLCVVLF